MTGVEYVQESNSSPNTGEGGEKGDKNPGGLGSKSLIAKLQWAWAACPRLRAARTVVDKEPTAKLNLQSRCDSAEPKGAAQHSQILVGEQRQDCQKS